MQTAADFKKWSPAGYRQLASGDITGAAKVPNVPPGARAVVITCEAQEVRFRDDETNPTAAIGHLLAVGERMFYCGNPHSLIFIEVAIGGIVNLSYYS